MAKRVQRRRGTTSEHSNFTGAEGEVTVDTTLDILVVHDGTTAGGHPVAKADGSNIANNSIGIVQLNVADGSAGYFLQTNGSGTLSFAEVNVSGTSLGGVLGGTIGNATIDTNSVGISQLNVSDGTANQFLKTDGSGTLSFGTVVTDPTMGGDVGGTTSASVIQAGKVLSSHLSTSLKNFTLDPQPGQTNTGDGVITEFNLSQTPGSVNSIIAYLDGIIQPPTAYALLTSPDKIQFTTAPPSGAVVRILHLGFQSTVGTPADGSITNAKLAANAVTTGKIAAGAVGTADIADDAITETQITAQTITNASIAANTITNTEIANDTITSTEIADNAIGGDKINIAGNVQGDVMYYDGSNWQRLQYGTTGHVLTTAGVSANPYWAAGSSGTALPGVGSSGNVLTSDGSNWVSHPHAALSGGVVRIRQVRNTAHLTWSNNNAWAVATGFTWAHGGIATSLAYTGIATTNRLQIIAYATLLGNATGYAATGLFSTQTLLGTARKQNFAGGKGYGTHIFTDIPVPSTSAVTYTLRFVGEGGTVYLNTDNGLNNPVGGESCGIIITEYTP